MSFWTKTGLILAGAAAGYFASKRGGQVVHAAQELVVRDSMQVDKRSNHQGAIDKIWASDFMGPVRRGALRGLKFAATVKQGMTEREDELNRRYANQKKDLRPGSLDTWGDTYNTENLSVSEPTREEARPDVFDGEAPVRDADLPPGFFTGGAERRER